MYKGLIIISILLNLYGHRLKECWNTSCSHCVLSHRFSNLVVQWLWELKKYWCLGPAPWVWLCGPVGIRRSGRCHECIFKFETLCSSHFKSITLQLLWPDPWEIILESSLHVALQFLLSSFSLFKPHPTCSKSLPPISCLASGVLFFQSVTTLLPERLLSR